jgi:hypothetical protein
MNPDKHSGRIKFDMKFFLLIICFCTAFSAVADEKTITNKVDNSKSLNTATNKVEMTAEQRLLAAFPQLLWSRAKLEFMFEKRAELGSALGAGANSDDQAFKLAKQMEAVFKKDDDIKTFTEGWKMAGRIHSQSANFTKPGYTLSGITGEIQLLFERDELISFGFWTDGSDADFAKLYQVLIRACGSPGERIIRDKDDSKISWMIAGNTNRYVVELSHRRWVLSSSVEVERGMTIFLKQPTRESAPKM